MQDPENEEYAIKYIQALNGNGKYEDSLLFAQKWKYTWFQNLTGFYGDGISKVRVDDTEIKIRPIVD